MAEMIDRKEVQKGISYLINTYDSDEVLAVVEAARAFFTTLSDDLDSIGGLSEKDRAALRGWAESAAVNPKSSKSRWVAEKVLRLLRENFNLKVRNK